MAQSWYDDAEIPEGQRSKDPKFHRKFKGTCQLILTTIAEAANNANMVNNKLVESDLKNMQGKPFHAKPWLDVWRSVQTNSWVNGEEAEIVPSLTSTGPTTTTNENVDDDDKDDNDNDQNNSDDHNEDHYDGEDNKHNDDDDDHENNNHNVDNRKFAEVLKQLDEHSLEIVKLKEDICFLLAEIQKMKAMPGEDFKDNGQVASGNVTVTGINKNAATTTTKVHSTVLHHNFASERLGSSDSSSSDNSSSNSSKSDDDGNVQQQLDEAPCLLHQELDINDMPEYHEIFNQHTTSCFDMDFDMDEQDTFDASETLHDLKQTMFLLVR